jgi:carboxypeptidase Taq
VLLLVRDKAALLGQALNLPPYDALVDEFSPGVGTADIDAIFKALSRRLPAMIGEALELQQSQPVLPITGRFGTSKQRSLVVEVMKAVGFPFDQGRLDESEHPFTEGVIGDIRITTRYDAADPFAGLLGALHETGHAMYDLGMPKEWRDQPVGRDRGMALEESQSLLLEMIIGRSAPFLRYLQPLLQKHYGATGPEWEFDNLQRMLTRVRRSLIRVDADEMSYPLHIMQRYDIEKQLLAGKLAVRDLPEAWNAGMEQRFGSAAHGTADGCLQDMHWALGSLRLFPSMRSDWSSPRSLWEALRNELPEVDALIERGEFAPIFGWLRDNMHGYGAKLPIKELIKQASGQALGRERAAALPAGQVPGGDARERRVAEAGAAAAPRPRGRAIPARCASSAPPARPGRQGDRRLSMIEPGDGSWCACRAARIPTRCSTCCSRSSAARR